MDPKYYEVGPGWAAFVATFALTVAVVLLFRSLNKHLRKVRLEAAKPISKPLGAPIAHTTDADKQRLASGLSVEDRDRSGDVVAREAGDGE